MTIDYIDVPQGTDEWLALRAGKLTASMASVIISKGQTRISYLNKLCAELETGEIEPSYTNKYMDWGIEHEPQARAMYELREGVEIEQVGFAINSDHPGAGASPDGLLAFDGLIEIKCPKTTTHMETAITRKIDGKYIAQMQMQMLITGRAYCDFVSFDPRVRGDKSMFIIRVPRDETFLKEKLCPAMLWSTDYIIARIAAFNS